MPHRQQQQPRFGGSTPHSPAITLSAPPPTPTIQVSSTISSFAMMCPPEAMAAVAAVEASQSADIVSRRELDRAKRERYFKKISELMNEQRLIEHELERMDQHHNNDDEDLQGGTMLPPLDLPPSQQPPHRQQRHHRTDGIPRTHHHDHSPLHQHADTVLQRLGASLHDDGCTHISLDVANRTANRFLYQTADNSCEMTADMEHSIDELVAQIVHSIPLICPSSSSLPPSTHTASLTHPPAPSHPTTVDAYSNIFDVWMSVSGAPNHINESSHTELVLRTPATGPNSTEDKHVAIPFTLTAPDDNDGDQHHHHAIVTTTITTTTPPSSQQHRLFPYRAVAVLALVMFNESLAFTMSIPFIGLFVAHLQGISPDDAGYTSGFLVGSFMFGQVISGKYWGQFSDSYGRKPAMMTGLFLGGVFVTLFGLSSSLVMAMIVRLVHGVCFGNCLVAKAMIAEVIEEKDQAIGFSVVSITWSTGTMLGPAIGGFLYNPTRYFDHDTSVPLMGPDSLLATYPALFPSALCALYSLVAFILVEKLLCETNQFAKPLPTVTEMTRHVSGKAKRTWKKQAKYVSSLSPTASVQRGNATTYTNSAVASPTTTSNTATSKNALRSTTYGIVVGPETNSPKAGGESHFISYPEITEEDADNKNLNEARVMGSGAPSNSRRVEHGVNRWVEDQVSTSVSPSLLPAVNPVPHRAQSTTRPPATSSRGTVILSTKSESDTVTFANEDRQGGYSDSGTTPIHDDDTTQIESTASAEVAGFGYADAFRNPATRMAIILYMIICFSEMAFLEILPLWAVASLSSGGLALQPDDVAIIVALSSISGLIANIAFPKIIRKLKSPLSLFPLSVLLWVIPSLIVPSLTRYLNVHSPEGSGNSEQERQQTTSTFWMIATVVIITIPRSFGEGWGFSIVFIMTARAAPPGAIGAMTGIAQSLGACLRCIAPLLSAPLFAWSISSSGRKFPFDESFAFLVASLPMFCCIPVGRALEAHLDKRFPPTSHPTSSLEIFMEERDINNGTTPPLSILKATTTTASPPIPSTVGKTTTSITNNINKSVLVTGMTKNKTAPFKLHELQLSATNGQQSYTPQRYGVEDCRMEEDLLQPLPPGSTAVSSLIERHAPTPIPITSTATISIHPPGEVIVDQLIT